MKSNWAKGVLVFLGAATAGAVLFNPAWGVAATWRQYSAPMCAVDFQEGGLVQGGILTFQGILENAMTTVDNNPINFAGLICPVVEDEAGHAKGGTVVHVSTRTSSVNWPSSIQACTVFDGASGGQCSPQVSVTPAGFGTTVTTTVTPSAAVWSTGAGYGYIYVRLGNRTSQVVGSNELDGYWISHT
jgi:hypothetical protein